MIPRYLPRVQLGAWRHWLATDNEMSRQDRQQFLTELGVADGWHASVFPRARHALRACLPTLPGTVVLSAQLCPLVARITRAAGHQVHYLDVAQDGLTPTPESYAAALDLNPSAMVIAPLYGHLPGDWSNLRRRLQNERPFLILDLAQGLGLEAARPLFDVADAIVYSFALGKGLDSGGGLLLTRQPPAVEGNSQSLGVHLGSLLQAILLRGSIATGTYAWLTRSVDAAIEADKVPENLDIALPSAATAFSLWNPRLGRFRKEVEQARLRAVTMRSLVVHRAGLDGYYGLEPTHLRQIVYLLKASWRDPLLRELRRGGVDACPAGEPLPSEYDSSARAGLFPNSAAFSSRSIRLPFLGRLSNSEFNRICDVWEGACARCLSA